MGKKRWSKLFLAGFTAFSLVSTSLGGAFATAALAAAPEEDAQQAGTGEAADNKAVFGGLLALGLIAVLANGGDGGDSDASLGKTPISSPQSSQQVATQPASQTTTQQPGSTTPRLQPVSVTTTQQISIPLSRPAATSQSQPAAGSTTTASSVTADEQRALELLNADRAANGLKPLTMNLRIVAVARAHAQDMINRNFFAHQNPDGLSPFDRMRRAGISFGYAGENLALNRSVDSAERALMNSPGHRANILNPNYTEVGIGIRYDSSGSLYLVQNFIGR